MNKDNLQIGAVIIGRNEGQRLINCISSVLANGNSNLPVVYVDSGSTDGSQTKARELGCEVVELDMSTPFSAARARNSGWTSLVEQYPYIEYVQFIDGDCELQRNWLGEASSFLDKNIDVAVVCGRRRERYPKVTVYNAICDCEWDTPIGEAISCGGDALIKVNALKQVGGYKDYFIAGEEPELCHRIRAEGSKVYRIDCEMTLHDANITTLKQWWKRAERAGFAYALSVREHGKQHNIYFKKTMNSLMWSAIYVTFLVLIFIDYTFGIFSLLLLVQLFRLSIKMNGISSFSIKRSGLLMLSKVPETIGIFSCIRKSLLDNQFTIIEYK